MSSRDFMAWRLDGDAASEVPERVVEEGPLSVRVNGKPFTITLRTPGDDRALVMGLLYSESLIDAPADILSMNEVTPSLVEAAAAPDAAATWDVTVRERSSLDSKLSNRSLASTSSCGFCGKTEWEDAAVCATSEHPEADTATPKSSPALTTAFLESCFGAMRDRQDLFGATGGSHAAALFSVDGRLLGFGEDAGRHNAVDKAVGRLWERGELEPAKVLCVSGRVSYEIASKALRAGVTVLAAVSAPSSMAVTFCRENDITLIGFSRGRRATVYATPRRVAGIAALKTQEA
jgi:FdhD protein